MNNNKPEQKVVRKKYSPQFKDQALERIAKDGVPQVSVLTQFDGRLFTINDGLMATKNVQSPYCT